MEASFCQTESRTCFKVLPSVVKSLRSGKVTEASGDVCLQKVTDSWLAFLIFDKINVIKSVDEMNEKIKLLEDTEMVW